MHVYYRRAFHFIVCWLRNLSSTARALLAVFRRVTSIRVVVYFLPNVLNNTGVYATRYSSCSSWANLFKTPKAQSFQIDPDEIWYDLIGAWIWYQTSLLLDVHEHDTRTRIPETGARKIESVYGASFCNVYHGCNGNSAVNYFLRVADYGVLSRIVIHVFWFIASSWF